MDLQFRTIKEICCFFGADFQKVKRGFQSKGAINHPTENHTTIWWPSAIPSKSGWKNSLNLEKTEIVETHLDKDKHDEHVDYILNHASRTTRFVFYKENRKSRYKFVGVFDVDREKTTIHAGVVWKKIDDNMKLP